MSKETAAIISAEDTGTVSGPAQGTAGDGQTEALRCEYLHPPPRHTHCAPQKAQGLWPTPVQERVANC